MINCHSLCTGCIVGWDDEQTTCALLTLHLPNGGHVLWKYNFQGYFVTPHSVCFRLLWMEIILPAIFRAGTNESSCLSKLTYSYLNVMNSDSLERCTCSLAQ